MSKEMRNLVDGMLAYALQVGSSDDKPAGGDCWELIAQARRCLREMERLPAQDADAAEAAPGREAVHLRALEVLRRDGLTIGECMHAHAAPDDDPYVAAAREAIVSDDDVEIDAYTATARGEGGAWVLAWLWISDQQAGVLSHSEMLEEVSRRAGEWLTGTHGLDDATAWLRNHQVLWLEEVCSRCCREIDGIETLHPGSEPGPVVWIDERGQELRFVPSEAVRALLALARSAGLKRVVAQHCERFCARHGRTLDAFLSAVRPR